MAFRVSATTSAKVNPVIIPTAKGKVSGLRLSFKKK